MPCVGKDVETPTGATYNGIDFEGRICGVSIMRAGEAMEQGLRECCRYINFFFIFFISLFKYDKNFFFESAFNLSLVYNYFQIGA